MSPNAAAASESPSRSRLIDADGFATVLDRPPRRIVSVALATDEMLLDLVGTERIAALSTFAGDPVYSNVAELAPRVVGRARGDAEAIVALDPDFVLATEFMAVEVVESLRGCGIPVHRIRRHESLDDIVHDYEVIGRALGEPEQSRRKAGELRQRLEAVSAFAKPVGKPPSLLLLNAGGYTAGVGTLWDDMVRRAGGANHAARLGIVGYGVAPVELVIADPPDGLVLASADGTSPGWLAGDAHWREVVAVREARWLLLPARQLSTVSQHAVACCEGLSMRLWSSPPDRHRIR